MSSITKFAFLATAAIMLFAAPASQSFAASKADCEALFAKADTDGDGSITGAHEDMKWEEALLKSSHIKPGNAGVVSKAEFMTGCEMGDFDQMMK